MGHRGGFCASCDDPCRAAAVSRASLTEGDLLPLDIVHTVCPHDCPSACALAVERIDGVRIGRVRGAEGQSYTQGVICAKVARYAERQHHPERLSTPLRRIGAKGRGRDAFVPVSWDDALDEVAKRFT